MYNLRIGVKNMDNKNGLQQKYVIRNCLTSSFDIFILNVANDLLREKSNRYFSEFYSYF